MEFTPSEREMIAALRKKHRAAARYWPKWIALFFSLSCIASSIWLFASLTLHRPELEFSHPPDATVDFILLKGYIDLLHAETLSIMLGFCMFVAGCHVLVSVAIHWRPNPSEALLLKFLEQNKRPGEADEKS